MNKECSFYPLLRYNLFCLPILFCCMLLFHVSPAQEEKENPIRKLDKGQFENNCIAFSAIEKDSVVFYIDARKVKQGALKDLNPEEIAQIQVLKGNSARELTKNKAISGAVIITTKANENAARVKSFNKKISRATAETKAAPTEKKSGIETTPDMKDALILLDGEPISYTAMEKIAPESIQSIDILKGPAAIRKYGKKGENGVIKITSK